MTRPRKLATLLAASALLLAACGGDDVRLGGDEDGAAPASQAKPVAMIVAQGGLGDQSYNDLANSGFQRAVKATGVQGRPIESQDIVAQGEQVLRRAGEGGFGAVVDLEFSHGEILGPIAKDFPAVQWAIINTVVEGPNVTSVLFQEQEGSYLAGALAALMTTTTGNPKINPDKKIGVIGGTKSVGIDKFIVGYIQGARDVDPAVQVLVRYANDFGDPAKGKQLANALYEQGADIVYQVAGGTGTGVIEAAKEANHYAIGVDTDQDGLAKGFVLTSMIKRTDLAVERLVTQHAEGSLKGGGTVTLGLKDDGVGLSSFKYTADQIPADARARIDQLREQIVAGQVKVHNVVEQGYPAFFK
jgi:basic membrane protein A and related proteins